MSTELDNVNNAVAAFDRVAAGLGALQKTYGGVVFDVTTTAGMTEAKEARAAIRAPRYEVENLRKEAKAPILALGRKLDTEAARITAELMKIEMPIHESIAAEESRKEREKQERIAAEVRRVNDIQQRIEAMRLNSIVGPTSGPAFIQLQIDLITAIDIDDSFAEFTQQAQDAKVACLYRLNESMVAAKAHVAEQERIASERAELSRLKAEQAQRDAADRARREDEERVAKAARDAEAARLAEENRKQAEANQAERDRIAAEDRRQQEQRDQIARDQAALEAAKVKPTGKGARKCPPQVELVQVIADHYQVSTGAAYAWLKVTFRS